MRNFQIIGAIDTALNDVDVRIRKYASRTSLLKPKDRVVNLALLEALRADRQALVVARNFIADNREDPAS